MAELHSPGALLKPRWEELHADTASALCRQSNTTPDLSSQPSTGGGFLISIPTYSSTAIPSASCGNAGHGIPTECPPFVGQVPYITTVNNNENPPAITYKQGSNIATDHVAEQQPDGNEMNGHRVNVGQVLVELERERQKNAELLSRLSSLEAQLQGKEKASAATVDQDDSPSTIQNGIKKLKRTRRGEKVGEGEVEVADKMKISNKGLRTTLDNLHTGIESTVQQDTIVNWMSREEVQLPDSDRFKDCDSDREIGESDDSDDDDSENEYDDDEEDEDEDTKIKDSEKKNVMRQMESEGTGIQGLENVCDILDDGKCLNVKVEVQDEQGHFLSVVDLHQKNADGDERRVRKMKKKKEGKKNQRYDRALYGRKCPGYEIGPLKAPGVVLSYKKAPKTAFCPKEIKRIMESGVLALKNAQSHTMRKIIVFASLGIRHGCEDMYDLDFNHFTILRRGEPYLSPKDPGEHVLYEQPGVRRKIFYPNRQNPILCPIHILEEERAMRPSDASCPSCLFLCIKYGGRTRNLPQNEYVRQRMGRNKLKSFGPLMCQMALLVHVRTGSFFFKALGITLLFMAGFTDDLVRRETKYCNLDLLQKYYRPDEDAEGEELFHPYPMFYALQAVMNAPTVPAKGVSAGSKSSGKRPTPMLLSKPSLSQAARFVPPISARSMSSGQFVPSGFHHPLTPSGVSLPLSPPHLQSAPPHATTAIVTSIAAPTGPLAPVHPPYSIFPPYALQRPPGGFLPMPGWHHVSSYFPNQYPSSPYGYQSLRPSSRYGAHLSQPYYNQLCFPPFSASIDRELEKKNDELDESESDSDSSSSEAEDKSNKSNSFESKD